MKHAAKRTLLQIIAIVVSPVRAQWLPRAAPLFDCQTHGVLYQPHFTAWRMLPQSFSHEVAIRLPEKNRCISVANGELKPLETLLQGVLWGWQPHSIKS